MGLARPLSSARSLKSLSGLEYWFLKDQGKNLNGSRIASYADVSGKGRIATQSTPGLQPHDDPKGIYFAPDTEMVIPYAPGLNPSQFTLFLFFEPVAIPSYGGLISTISSTGRMGWNLEYGSTQNIASYQGNGTATYEGGTVIPAIGERYLLTLRHANPGTYLQVNDQAEHVNPSRLISYEGNTNIYLNRFYTNLASLRGDFYWMESALYSRFLSNQEVAFVKGDILKRNPVV